MFARSVGSAVATALCRRAGHHALRNASTQRGGYNQYQTALQKFSRQIDSSLQEVQVKAPRNFDTTELLQVRRKPLRIEQDEFANAQMFCQRNERDL